MLRSYWPFTVIVKSQYKRRTSTQIGSFTISEHFRIQINRDTNPCYYSLESSSLDPKWKKRRNCKRKFFFFRTRVSETSVSYKWGDSFSQLRQRFSRRWPSLIPSKWAVWCQFHWKFFLENLFLGEKNENDDQKCVKKLFEVIWDSWKKFFKMHPKTWNFVSRLDQI